MVLSDITNTHLDFFHSLVPETDHRLAIYENITKNKAQQFYNYLYFLKTRILKVYEESEDKSIICIMGNTSLSFQKTLKNYFGEDFKTPVNRTNLQDIPKFDRSLYYIRSLAKMYYNDYKAGKLKISPFNISSLYYYIDKRTIYPLNKEIIDLVLNDLSEIAFKICQDSVEEPQNFNSSLKDKKNPSFYNIIKRVVKTLNEIYRLSENGDFENLQATYLSLKSMKKQGLPYIPSIDSNFEVISSDKLSQFALQNSNINEILEQSNLSLTLKNYLYHMKVYAVVLYIPEIIGYNFSVENIAQLLNLDKKTTLTYIKEGLQVIKERCSDLLKQETLSNSLEKLVKEKI